MDGNLDCRISRLERQNQWLKVIGLFGFIFFGAVLLMGQSGSTEQAVPKEIKAQTFHVVDQTGKTRILLSAMGKGAYLMISDDGGKPLAILSASPNGSSLHLNDKGGNTKIFLVVSGQTDLGQMILYGKDRKSMWKVPESK